jgi:hypothetical protein
VGTALAGLPIGMASRSQAFAAAWSDRNQNRAGERGLPTISV